MAIDRRHMLKGTALTFASMALPPAYAARSARRIAASDRVNVAAIGAGGMGAANMEQLTGQNIVAIADPDLSHVAQSFVDKQGNSIARRAPLRAAYDKATQYADYRRMFDRQKDIDAVVIATPDQHHAVAARMAMERGIHVYVQKPLTYTVRESRVLSRMAADNPRLVTQMGNQGHSGDDGRRVVEWIRAGVIGDVREVHIWTDRPIWPQGIARPVAEPKPGEFDWDVWLGPSTVNWGYNRNYAHFNWRGWVPFGCGALGDMGAHLIDFPLWALEPGLPTRIETRHSAWGQNDRAAGLPEGEERGSYPLASATYFEFGNAPGGPLKITWYDGGMMPPTPHSFPPSAVMNKEGGVLYVGSRGMLMHDTYGEKPVLIGEGVTESAAQVPVSLPRIMGGLHGHEMNWIRAIRGEEAISSPFSVGAPLTETMLLGIVAMRTGGPIDYDGATGRITNVPDANRYLDRTYRKGWEL